MIITTQKPLAEILEYIGSDEKIFLVGCNLCATICKTGGGDELTGIERSLGERQFKQSCALCGECILALTGAICPVSRCAKELLNGPCGGAKNGKCEVDKDLECVWLGIYDRLKELGKLDKMKVIREPKDHSKSKKNRDISVR